MRLCCRSQVLQSAIWTVDQHFPAVSWCMVVYRHTAMSCSEDGSVRIWDTEALTQRTVLKPTLSKPGRFTVSACAYNSDGGMIAAGLKDGSIQMWDVRGSPPLPSV